MNKFRSIFGVVWGEAWNAVLFIYSGCSMHLLFAQPWSQLQEEHLTVSFNRYSSHFPVLLYGKISCFGLEAASRLPS